MTLLEKREFLMDFCKAHHCNEPCPLRHPVCRCGYGVTFISDIEGCQLTDEEIEEAFDIVNKLRAANITAEKPNDADDKAVTRGDILCRAFNCVCGDREQDYGRPENNFRTIANLWIDYLSAKDDPLEIEPKDVAAMLALLKIARIASGHAKADNWVDLAGYAACGGEIEMGGTK